MTHGDAVQVSRMLQLEAPLEVVGEVESSQIDPADTKGRERAVLG